MVTAAASKLEAFWRLKHARCGRGGEELHNTSVNGSSSARFICWKLEMNKFPAAAELLMDKEV